MRPAHSKRSVRATGHRPKSIHQTARDSITSESGDRSSSITESSVLPSDLAARYVERVCGLSPSLAAVVAALAGLGGSGQ